MDVQVEGLFENPSMRMLGDIRHQLLAADIHIEACGIRHLCTFEECINVVECRIDIVKFILDGVVEGVALGLLGNHRQRGDGLV